MLPVLHLDRSSPETCPRDTGDPSAGLGQEYQCPSLQFQAIASAASSSRVTISSGSKAIGAHTRVKLAVSQHTRAPNAQLQNIALLLLAALAIDRKSTRLNSSHVSISYAVFCLK